jgi:threonine dehydrogenase-like Zn-dependent dehydrogenase
MSETMQAAVLAAPRRFELRETARPRPAKSEVRIQVQGCGVCGSNGPPWEGRPWFSYPMPAGAPGHEGWGVVDEVGAGVSSIRPGQRVAFLSGHALAEYDVAAADAVVRLPAALDGQPFPGEPLGCAMNVFARSDIRPGQTVAVVGVGFIGAVVISLARAAGARVIALGRRPFALSLARTYGAEATLELEQDSTRIVEEVRERNGGALCDRVIEAVGLQKPLDLAAELTRERGRLIIAGYHQDGGRLVNMQMWNWRGLDVINAHERDPAVYVAGMRAAVDAVVTGRLDPRPLYTHAFALGDTEQAFQALEQRPAGFLKALVTT